MSSQVPEINTAVNHNSRKKPGAFLTGIQDQRPGACRFNMSDEGPIKQYSGIGVYKGAELPGNQELFIRGFR